MLMITSLTIRNWRTHADTTVEFGKGTNVIIGVMGSGKSSVVNAISYALFGTFPAVKGRQVSLEEIITNKPNPQAKSEVVLEFDVGGEKYKVERIIKRDGTNEAKLYSNGVLSAGPKQKDVNEKVEKLLGLDYELFSRAAYSEQNELDSFLKLSPSERKKKFDELLELEKYEVARKNGVMIQNDLIKENKQRKEQIEQQKKIIEGNEEEKIKKQIEEETLAITELEKEMNALTNEISLNEKEYLEIQKKEKEHRTLEDNLLRSRSRVETLREEVKRMGSVNLNEVLQGIEKIKSFTSEIGSKISALEKEYKERDSLGKKNNEELKVKEYEVLRLEREEKGINAMSGKCPSCKRELTVECKNDMLTEITPKIAQLKSEIEKLNTAKKELTPKLLEIEEMVRFTRKESDAKNKELYSLENLKKQALDSEEKKKQLTLLEEELPKLEKMLNESQFDKKKLEMVRDELYKKKSSLSVAQARIGGKKEIMKGHESMLEKLVLIRKNILEQESTMIKASEAAEKLGVFSNCLVHTQGELREKLIETINSAMSTIWGTIYPYKDFIDARLKTTTEGYDLEVLNRNNEWTRVEGILSGGERSAAALCIRMAFALVLTKKLSMLILDEPTHNLDSNAVAKLSTMLREEMPKLVEQVFVITHDKQLENAASSNLYLLARDKNSDGATIAQMLEVR